MALDKATLKNEIKSLLQDMMQKENASFEEFATRLSDAVDVYVKTGTISTTVTGTCPAGAVAGTGTGTIG
jgi:hypothetical protein